MRLLILLLPLAWLPGLAYGQANKDILFAEEMATFNTELTIEEIRENQAERQRLLNQREAVRQNIRKYESKNRTLQTRLEKSRESLAETQKRHQKEAGVLSQIQETHNALVAANRSLDEQLGEADRLVNEQRQQITALRRDVNRAEQEQKRLIDRQERIKGELIKKRETLQSLRDRRERTQSRNDELSSDIRNLEEVNRSVSNSLSMFNN